MELGRAQCAQVLERTAPLPPGAGRDRRAVELLVDFALARPGLIALASRAISTLGAGHDADPDVDPATRAWTASTGRSSRSSASDPTPRTPSG